MAGGQGSHHSSTILEAAVEISPQFGAGRREPNARSSSGNYQNLWAITTNFVDLNGNYEILMSVLIPYYTDTSKKSKDRLRDPAL